MPAASVEPKPKKAGRKERKMVALSPLLYERLKDMARHHRRPVAWELRIVICKALVEEGRMSQEEADAAFDEDE